MAGRYGLDPHVLTFTCVKKGDLYGDEYVLRLQRGIARHMPHKDWEFVCLTDKPIPGILCQGLTDDLPGYWSKLELFKYSEPFLQFDLDVVITGSLQPLIDWDGFGIIKDYEVGIWDRFNPDMMKSFHGGDQHYISHMMPGAKTFPKEWFPSYKADKCQAGVPAEAIACIFHGRPKPHECNGWVAKTWV